MASKIVDAIALPSLPLRTRKSASIQAGNTSRSAVSRRASHLRFTTKMEADETSTSSEDKDKIYIGKKKDIFLGNVGEPRFIEDNAAKYPDKESYGPDGLFANSTGGWAGGEAGLKLMFLAAKTDKMKPGTAVNVRRGYSRYSCLKGTVKKINVGKNNVMVDVNLDEPAENYELVVAVACSLAFVGLSIVNYTTLNGITQSILSGLFHKDINALPLFCSTDIVAALGTGFSALWLKGRRTEGKAVTLPLELLFVPGVDKVSDPFWDGN